MVILYFVLVLVFAAFFGALGNSLVLNFAKTLGIRNKNDITVRWSNESKPSLGGVSMYMVFVISGFLVSIVLSTELELIQAEYIGLLIATSTAFAMGISDDAYDTKPLLKLFIQILCGVIFVFSNNSIVIFESEWLNSIATVLWVVILMNSLNMLDNMDGITGTVTLFTLLACLVLFVLVNGLFVSIWSLLLMVCIGSTIGFLIYNVHPSRLFMGDGGSQFIGVIVSFFTIKALINIDIPFVGTNYLGPVLALVALTPAAADTLTVVINRLKAGKSPMVGGKDHTTHHLVYSGKTDKQVWHRFLVLSISSCLMTIFIFYLSTINAYLSVLLGLFYFTLVFISLYRNTIKFPQKL